MKVQTVPPNPALLRPRRRLWLIWASFRGLTAMNAKLRQSLLRYILRFAAFCIVVTWIGCKSLSPYEQLELEQKKNEQMEQERERKNWGFQR